jgi:hypothetical protein
MIFKRKFLGKTRNRDGGRCLAMSATETYVSDIRMLVLHAARQREQVRGDVSTRWFTTITEHCLTHLGFSTVSRKAGSSTVSRNTHDPLLRSRHFPGNRIQFETSHTWRATPRMDTNSFEML